MTPKLSPSERAAIAAKIKALQAKTTQAGASEAEAMAAALKAHELLEKYQIDLGAEALREEGTSTSFVERNEVTIGLGTAISLYTSCRVWQAPAAGQIKFLGLRSDTEFAEWLFLSLSNFVVSNTLLYSLEHAVSRDLSDSYRAGMIRRLRERLTPVARQESSGRALIVLKNALVEEAFAALNMRLHRTRSTRQEIRHAEAFAAGQVKGNDAGFDRPMARAAGQLAIGRSEQ